MKPLAPIFGLLSVTLAVQAADTYTNFIYQYALPSTQPYSVQVDPAGSLASPMPISANGDRFELWTIKSSPLTEYHLDTQYVGAYSPSVKVTVSTLDNSYSTIPRTRVDKPITVTVEVTGLQSGNVPEFAKSVNYQQTIQSYGTDGTGQNIDHDAGTPVNTQSLTTNGTYTFPIDPAIITDSRGETRVTVNTVADAATGTPSTQVASEIVQVWPLTVGSISGISSGDKVNLTIPSLTFTLTNLYPESSVYAQIYDGPEGLGKTGTIIPGSQIELKNTIPENREITVANWDSVFLNPNVSNLTDKDGVKTVELVTQTPFGTERLGFVTFNLDRTIEVNSGITTAE
jgi:hypothetical protein